MRLLFFPALLLTTSVAAQDAPLGGGDWTPHTCHLTSPEIAGRDSTLQQLAKNIASVTDVDQCPGGFDPNEPCKDQSHCVVDISGSFVGNRDPRAILKEAVSRCNTTVRLGPNVNLKFPRATFRPLQFGRCVTLTSVNDFNRPTSAARTPRALGPALNYTEPDVDTHDSESPKTFLQIACNDTATSLLSDHIRISGFRLYGPNRDNQLDLDVGIRITRCVDVEISNMEIAGWGRAGIVVANRLDDQPPRIKDPSQIRIHDNFINHNQHPTSGGSAEGYGIDASSWAHIYRNVFDFNRHAIAASGQTEGYVAEENLVLKGGGWHGQTLNRYTHIFDVHGTENRPCVSWFNPITWEVETVCRDGWGGQAGGELSFFRNSFQYRSDKAIKIRGKPLVQASIDENVFAHDSVGGALTLYGGAISLYTADNVEIGPRNIPKTDTFGEYYTQCDFDGDGIDDLFLATGATWWFSSSGKFHWSFLATSSKRKKDLKFGYFDEDDRCDVLTESGGSGRWFISSGGTGPWRPLEEVWGPVQWKEDMWAPFKDVEFGRFDPSDRSATRPRRTTHAFHRVAKSGEWLVKKLKDPTAEWEYVGGSQLALKELRFGDFTGDGVTDVLAVQQGRWAISESARKPWRRHNDFHGDAVANLFIANMDVDREDREDDDKIDDILRLEVRTFEQFEQGEQDVELTWWRSRNGVDRWREWRKYRFKYIANATAQHGLGFVYPRFGFVGRFGAVSGGTLVVDAKRFGHVYSPGSFEVWMSLFPY